MNRSTLLIVLACAAGIAGAQAPDFRRIMITEVSWSEPQGIEITNFAASPIDLTAWSVVWITGLGIPPFPSVTLDGVIQSGETILVTEISPVAIPEAPPTTRILPLLPTMSAYTTAITFGLRNAANAYVDEVRVSATGGSSGLSGFPGSGFRGVAARTLPLAVSVERIWGLDSDAGRDWTEEVVRSFGLENRSSGARGTDTLAEPQIRITEIDDSPDFVELYNNGNTGVDLRDFLLLASWTQGAPPSRILPFPSSVSLAAGSSIVIGDTAAGPAELPAGVPYVNLSAIGGSNLPFVGTEFSLGLYDNLGRLLDLVRVTGDDDGVVHNHPRAPAHWSAFTGSAPRQGSVGAGSLGRAKLVTTFSDTDKGSDWRALFTRSMGAYVPAWVGSPGLGDVLDVRLNETGMGDGMTIIINAGAATSGFRYSFFFSLGHLEGTGPFFGLGPEALENWIGVLASPPFTGTLDLRGSARVDLASGSLPPGIQFDCIFILQTPSGAYDRRTAILEYDS